MKTLLETMTEALDAAEADNYYGCYDFSSYPGDAPPYVIRVDGRSASAAECHEVCRGTDHEAIQNLYHQLVKARKAQMLIKAMSDWLEADLKASFARYQQGF